MDKGTQQHGAENLIYQGFSKTPWSRGKTREFKRELNLKKEKKYLKDLY